MGNLAKEYKAAKETAAWMDLSNSGVIEVHGEDRVSFLNQVTSNDLKNLKVGESCQTALLSATAKVLAFMDVFAFKDKLLLITEPSFEKKWIVLFDKYIITEDVSLKEATEDYGLFHLVGPKASEVLNAFKTTPFRDSLNPNVFKWLIPRAHVKELMQEAKQAGVCILGKETQEILRVESGQLRYGMDITDEVSLSETGLDETAASETKGCYPGQEVVAKTKTYKGLQRKAVKLLIKGEPLPKSGEKIYAEDQEIGWVTSAVRSQKYQAGLAIGYVRKGYFEKSQQVQIHSTTGKLEAETLPLR